MAVTVYASASDFFGPGGAPPTIVGSLSLADVNDALTKASALMDGFFRGRFPLPFASVGAEVSLWCVQIARYLFLQERGMSPVTGSDERVVKDYESALEWLDKVQRRVFFPSVTIDSTAAAIPVVTPDTYVQPMVTSSSMVGVATGRTDSTRGW